MMTVLEEWKEESKKKQNIVLVKEGESETKFRL